MKSTSRLVLGALVAWAIGSASAQTLTDGGGLDRKPTGNAGMPQIFPAGKCDGSICRLRVHSTANCKVTVDPDWVFITGRDVQIFWELENRDFFFPEVGGIEIKPRYFSEGVFSDSHRVDPQTWTVRDSNNYAGVARYTVTVVNRITNEQCSVDPGAVNDWP